MARWKKTSARPDARVALSGHVLAETSVSVVMRCERHPEGAAGRAVLVVAHESLTSSRIAKELREIACTLEAQALGLTSGVI